MKETRHRRGKSSTLSASPNTSDAPTRHPGHNSPPPIHGILKKKSTFDAKKPHSRTRETSPNVSRLPSFSISGINEVSLVSVESVERIISTLPDVENNPKTKVKVSPRTRYSPDCGEETKREKTGLVLDEKLVSDVRAVIASIKLDMQRAKSARAQVRKSIFSVTLRLLETTKAAGSEKDQSLVVLGSDDDSGSETERMHLANNRAAIGLAVQTYASDPQQMKDLLEVMEATGTPRLSLLMRKNKVEGLYKQGNGGWKKVYGGKDAPPQVDPSMISSCFEIRETTLAPMPQKQVWKADAFVL